MLKQEDRDAIEGLFERLDTVERRGGERDVDAEDLIHRRIRQQPGAPYYMAQTILVQEHALSVAEERIAELERQLQGGRGTTALRTDADGDHRGYRDERGIPPRGPWGSAPRDDYAERDRNAGMRGGFGGGGFLAGAAQTALGVAGGVLIGQAIGSMFGGSEAQAAEAPSAEPAPEPTTDAGQDTGDAGSDFGGGDDFGGFDTGGDF